MRATLFFRFILLHVLIFTLLRIVFFLAFSGSGEYSAELVLKAFLLGFRFDLRLILLLLAPLVLLVWLFSPIKSQRADRFWRAFYTIIGAAVFLVYFFDFGFYGYLNSRINSAIMAFLENPDISLGMMWESYPMVWITIGFVGVLFLYTFLLKRFVFYPLTTSFLNLPRWLVNVSFVFVFLAGLYGSIAQYPLRWSEAFFSPHHFISHLSLNPILYFAETHSFTKQQSYNMERVKAYYPVITEYMGSKTINDDKYLLPRFVKGNSVTHPYNVVVIVMESMAMSKTNFTENSLNPTPYLEKIAAEGILFKNHYSPVESTARNMFSIMTAIPDVTYKDSSTRNPLVVDQKLIANSYKNYRKMYFLGGSASWANIRGIFSHNIEGIEIVEEGSFDRSKTDVWGISDLDLFIEADKVFASVPQKQPFFAVIQSASFHRPYTIPANSLDFKKSEPLTPEKLKEGGFYSQEQYDSLRFSDYSLGHFFELAKKKPYFKNTLFVITGDHGLPDEGGANVPAGSHLWELEKYHVPLVFVNSTLFPIPTVDGRMSSHTDIMTSVAMAVGIDHENTTLGRSLWNVEFDKERYSFIFNYYSEIGEFGLIGPRYYYRYDTLKKGQLYDLTSQEPTLDIKNQVPEIFSRMEALAKAQIEYARYLLFHNHKEEKP